MSKRARLALVGAGRMGGALLRRWLESGYKPSEIIVVAPRPSEALEALARRKRLTLHAEWPEGRAADLVLIGVKPQTVDGVAAELTGRINDDAVIVSIAAGRTIASLKHAFGERPIARAMPNTPVAVGQGATAFVTCPMVSAAQAKAVAALFNTCGLVEQLDAESQIDAVTAISGSGPAYVFLMTEALAGAGRAEDMPEDVAARLARQTVVGAAALLADSDQSPAEMRRDVTSPGGTTAAALDVLYEVSDTLSGLVRRAVSAAARRARELGR